MRVLICLAVLLLLLSACTGNSSSNEPMPPFEVETTAPAQSAAAPEPSASDGTPQVIYSLKEIIPYLDDVTRISVRADPTAIAFNAFAPADKAQTREIVDFLMLLKTTEFIETEPQSDELQLTSRSILIENAFGSCRFTISGDVDDNSIFYIILFPDQTAADILAGEEQLPLRFFKGQSREFPIRDFNTALKAVLFDTTDLQNVAVVQMIDGDTPECTFFKGHTATLRYALEDAVELYSTAESPEEQSFDIKIVIGDTTYLLSSTSGIFSKENNGSIIFSRFDENKLPQVLMLFKIFGLGIS